MKNYFKRYGIFYSITLLLAICLYLVSILYTNRGILILCIGLVAMIVIGVVPALFVYASYTGSVISLDHKKTEDLLRHSLSETTSKEEEAQDILELTLINTKELRYFYTESRQQAKRAFFLASIMSVMGGLLMFLSIGALMLLRLNTPTLTLGAIGGAIVELIAGTAFYIYRKALKQYNHYYRSLHENERLLMILNLTCKLSKDISERQAEMYMEIIRSQLNYINREFWLDIEKGASNLPLMNSAAQPVNNQ